MGRTFKRHKLDYDDSNYSDYKKTTDDIREKRKQKLEKQQHIGENTDDDHLNDNK